MANHLLTPFFQNDYILIVKNDPKLRSIAMLLTQIWLRIAQKYDFQFIYFREYF
jgi:hypothetical protein